MLQRGERASSHLCIFCCINGGNPFRSIFCSNFRLRSTKKMKICLSVRHIWDHTTCHPFVRPWKLIHRLRWVVTASSGWRSRHFHLPLSQKVCLSALHYRQYQTKGFSTHSYCYRHRGLRFQRVEKILCLMSKEKMQIFFVENFPCVWNE